jgi:hypothetical protein
MASILNPKWKAAPKKVDPSFEGSLFQKLGLSNLLCPTCGAHLSGEGEEAICLNACHLIPEGKETFHQLWLKMTQGTIDLETIIKNAQEWKERPHE